MSVPLSRPVISIWPLPSGLLLQVAEANSTCGPFSSSSPSLISRDMLRVKRDIKGYSPQNLFGFTSQFDITTKDGSSSSHLILRDPLAEPEVCTYTITRQ